MDAVRYAFERGAIVAVWMRALKHAAHAGRKQGTYHEAETVQTVIAPVHDLVELGFFQQNTRRFVEEKITNILVDTINIST